MKLVGFRFQAAPNFGCVLLTACEAWIGRKSTDFVFNSIEQTDLRNKPCGFGETFLKCFVRVAARVSETADALDARLAAAQRLVDFIGVGLDCADKICQSLAHGFESSAGVEVEKHIAAGDSVKPQITACGFAADFRVQALSSGCCVCGRRGTSTERGTVDSLVPHGHVPMDTPLTSRSRGRKYETPTASRQERAHRLYEKRVVFYEIEIGKG